MRTGAGASFTRLIQTQLISVAVGSRMNKAGIAQVVGLTRAAAFPTTTVTKELVHMKQAIPTLWVKRNRVVVLAVMVKVASIKPTPRTVTIKT